MELQKFSFSPSGLSPFSTGCPSCVWNQYAAGVKPPQTPFPGVLNHTAAAMEKFIFDGRKAASLELEGLPEGTLLPWRKTIHSAPIEFLDLGVEVSLRGRLDGYADHGDGTVSVLDAKYTTSSKVENPDKLRDSYQRQLAAYVCILENPRDPSNVPATSVVGTGLICATPNGDFGAVSGRAAFGGQLAYVPIACTQESRDEFVMFLRRLVETIALDERPEPSEDCPVCTYTAALAAL